MEEGPRSNLTYKTWLFSWIHASSYPNLWYWGLSWSQLNSIRLTKNYLTSGFGKLHQATGRFWLLQRITAISNLGFGLVLFVVFFWGGWIFLSPRITFILFVSLFIFYFFMKQFHRLRDFPYPSLYTTSLFSPYYNNSIILPKAHKSIILRFRCILTLWI